jgi:hypothetical protein
VCIVLNTLYEKCTTVLLLQKWGKKTSNPLLCTVQPNIRQSRSVLIALLNQTENIMTPFCLLNTEQSHSFLRVWNGAILFYLALEPNATLENKKELL